MTTTKKAPIAIRLPRADWQALRAKSAAGAGRGVPASPRTENAESERVSVTLRVSHATWLAFKIKVAQEETTMQAVLTEGVQSYLARNPVEGKSTQAVLHDLVTTYLAMR